MLGPIMRVQVNDKLSVRLAPFAKEDLGAFIEDGGMQRRSTTRYMGMDFAPTIETEQEWYDKIRTSPKYMVWGIWSESGGRKTLIGNTALSNLEESPFRQMTSGSVIFNQDYWGKGIASAIHKARTWYAFREMNLARVKSAVLLPNVASKKALQKSGYFFHSLERNEQFANGAFQHLENFECLNPSKYEWSRWWGDDTPTKAALEAREVTLAALKWADENVELL